MTNSLLHVYNYNNICYYWQALSENILNLYIVRHTKKAACNETGRLQKEKREIPIGQISD